MKATQYFYEISQEELRKFMISCIAFRTRNNLFVVSGN